MPFGHSLLKTASASAKQLSSKPHRSVCLNRTFPEQVAGVPLCLWWRRSCLGILFIIWRNYLEVRNPSIPVHRDILELLLWAKHHQGKTETARKRPQRVHCSRPKGSHPSQSEVPFRDPMQAPIQDVGSGLYKLEAWPQNSTTGGTLGGGGQRGQSPLAPCLSVFFWLTFVLWVLPWDIQEMSCVLRYSMLCFRTSLFTCISTSLVISLSNEASAMAAIRTKHTKPSSMVQFLLGRLILQKFRCKVLCVTVFPVCSEVLKFSISHVILSCGVAGTCPRNEVVTSLIPETDSWVRAFCCVSHAWLASKITKQLQDSLLWV